MFKLQTTMASTNFVLFSAEGKITRYEDEAAILKEFFCHRAKLYERRKKYMLANLEREFDLLSNKVRFIRAIISEELKVNRVKKQNILANLQKLGFKPLSKINSILEEFKTS
jgi:DNA topoisomerase II